MNNKVKKLYIFEQASSLMVMDEDEEEEEREHIKHNQIMRWIAIDLEPKDLYSLIVQYLNEIDKKFMKDSYRHERAEFILNLIDDYYDKKSTVQKD